MSKYEDPNCLLVDAASRARLASELCEQERPEGIEPLVWELIQNGELAQIDFDVLGTLIDNFGWRRILATLGWPFIIKDMTTGIVPGRSSDEKEV